MPGPRTCGTCLHPLPLSPVGDNAHLRKVFRDTVTLTDMRCTQFDFHPPTPRAGPGWDHLRTAGVWLKGAYSDLHKALANPPPRP